MAYLIEAENEIIALHNLLRSIIVRGKRNGNYLELLNCLLTIKYSELKYEEFKKCKDNILACTKELGLAGWHRATRVYTTEKDLPTKPSYLNRLTHYPDRPRRNPIETVDQIDTIARELATKPGYNTLSFIFLRPADLIDKFRPGYVPCPIAGDFKCRNSRLNLNVMFRTNDALGVGYADIYYLREIQLLVLEKAKSLSRSEKLKECTPGDLCLFFCRTYIEERKKLKDGRVIQTLPLAKKLIRSLKRGAGNE